MVGEANTSQLTAGLDVLPQFPDVCWYDQSNGYAKQSGLSRIASGA